MPPEQAAPLLRRTHGQAAPLKPHSTASLGQEMAVRAGIPFLWSHSKVSLLWSPLQLQQQQTNNWSHN